MPVRIIEDKAASGWKQLCEHRQQLLKFGRGQVVADAQQAAEGNSRRIKFRCSQQPPLPARLG